MASIADEQEIFTNNQTVETNQKDARESREGSAEKRAAAAAIRDRDEKLKLAKERQNEERQRKIEELRAQAEAAQRYREQKEEERRRRIEEIRSRDNEKRHQVEERKRAIMEAEKERREYILRKNLERDSRLEAKKRERSSIAFAFGSSTPRLLEPSDFGMVSTSTFWGQRRSTSISNVAGVSSLSRRSSERELTDSGTKKRATSASGSDRRDDYHRKTSSMYEVFNWGFINDEPPKRFSLSVVGSEINIDGPVASTTTTSTTNNDSDRQYRHNTNNSNASRSHIDDHLSTNDFTINRSNNFKEDNIDATSSPSHIVFRSVARRKTDLMPTIPTPRDGHHYGSRSSLSTTPRTPGSRSGNVTPGGNSRPGSAMSTSTTLSTTVTRRSAPVRNPRPASIAGTGVSLEDINKHKKESRPPLKTSSANAHLTVSAQTTPKRSSNLMSTSLIVTSSSSSLSNTPTDRKATPSAKREQKASLTPKSLSKTSSSDRLNKLNKTPKESTGASASVSPSSSHLTSMTKSAIVIASTQSGANQKSSKVKAEKKAAAAAALNTESEQSSKAPNTEAAEPNRIVAEATESMTITETETAEIAKEKGKVQSKKESEQIEKSAEKVLKMEEKVENGVLGVIENTETINDFGNNLSVIQNDNNNGGGHDAMTASMIARSKITTETEAKAALAEKRRLMREEAERQAELERQRIEAERLAEMKRQEEEAERQKKFEEESLRLAEEQRRTEEERLRQAIEEAKQREEEERRKRDDEERQRLEREEAEKKAKEEAEKQRIEVAERLKREEKEREERRKRVEAIMSRTRKGGGTNTNTPNSTPSKDSFPTNAQTQPEQKQQQQENALPTSTPSSDESSSPTASSTTSAITTPPQQQEDQQQQQQQELVELQLEPQSSNVAPIESTQAVYEQSVMDKENALINSFTNMIIDENAKNLLQQHQPQHQHQHQHQIEVTNGKLLANFPNSDAILQNLTTTVSVVANGNGHIENINNKNDINILQDVLAPTTVATTNQLIDLNMESQDINNVHFNNNNNNNNSLLAATATTANNTLVNADSHENAEISLL